MADRGAVRSRLLPVALLGALAAAGLTGCVDRTDATEDEITRVVTESFALLEAGKVEAASALDTFDAADAECPALFTDEVYATVTDRPTDLTILTVDHHRDRRAWVEATVDVAGQSAVAVDLALNREGDAWLIQVDTGPGNVFLSAVPSPGEVSIQGVCTTPLSDYLLATVDIYPGTWTVSYADPLGIGRAEEWAASSASLGRPSAERARVTVEVVPDPGVLARAQEAMDELVDECADSLLTSPACPEYLPEIVSRHPGPVDWVGFHSYPELTVENWRSSWRFTTDAPEVMWVDADGDEHETAWSYHGSVAVEDGAVVFTQGLP